MPDLANMLYWWQWLILAAVPPAIVALYFLKLRRRPLVVPSTYLWRKSIEDLHVNTIWQRLRRNVLLLLQLLVIAAVAMALLRPSWQGLKLSGGRFVFLVDNSASMQATDVAPSRLEEAKRLAGELIDQLKDGDAAMIVSFADTARIEQTFTGDRRRLRRALAAIRPTQRGTALLEALKVVSGLAKAGRAAGAPPAELLIFSDGRFPPVAGFSLDGLEPRFISVGRPEAANVGVVAFSTGRKESKPELLQTFARVQNFGSRPVAASVELSLDGRLIDAARLALPAGEARGVAFDLGDVSSGALRLRVAGDDQLAVDDEAFLAIGPPRRANVLLVTAGNEPLEMALKTSSARQLAEVTVEPPGFLKTPKYLGGAAGGAYQLVIYDRCRPPAMPRANTLFIDRLPIEGGWAAGKPVSGPAILDLEATHPLLQWIDLGDVLLVAASPLRTPPGGRVLIDSDAGPVLAIAPREAFEDAVLGFVLVDEAADKDGKPRRLAGTNWHIRPSFPTFVLNLLGYLGGVRDLSSTGTVGPGKPVVLDAPPAQTELEVRAPGGQTFQIKRGGGEKFNFTETETPGVYDVRGGGRPLCQFAVSLLDAAESDIRPRPVPSIQIGCVKVAGESGWETARWEIWKWLVLAGLFVLLLEWYIYRRRVYVY